MLGEWSFTEARVMIHVASACVCMSHGRSSFFLPVTFYPSTIFATYIEKAKRPKHTMVEEAHKAIEKS